MLCFPSHHTSYAAPECGTHSGTFPSFCISFLRSARAKTKYRYNGKYHAAVRPEPDEGQAKSLLRKSYPIYNLQFAIASGRILVVRPALRAAQNDQYAAQDDHKQNPGHRRCLADLEFVHQL